MRHLFLLVVFLGAICMNGCVARNDDYYTHAQLETSDSLGDIVAVQLITGTEIHFVDYSGNYSPSSKEVRGRSEINHPVVIPLSQIASCSAEPTSGVKSVLGTFSIICGGLIALVVILFAIQPHHGGPPASL